jgi:DNA-binding NarL/FixJ family response regulator
MKHVKGEPRERKALERRIRVEMECAAARLLAVPLSPREREVTQLIAGGARIRDVASRLGIVVKTVELHIYKAQKKLGLRNRRQLIRSAQDGGAID